VLVGKALTLLGCEMSVAFAAYGRIAATISSLSTWLCGHVLARAPLRSRKFLVVSTEVTILITEHFFRWYHAGARAPFSFRVLLLNRGSMPTAHGAYGIRSGKAPLMISLALNSNIGSSGEADEKSN
jgi:hypothetical protein